MSVKDTAPSDPKPKPKSSRARMSRSPKQYELVNSGLIGTRAVKVGDTVLPKNQRQEKELRRRKLIK